MKEIVKLIECCCQQQRSEKGVVAAVGFTVDVK